MSLVFLGLSLTVLLVIPSRCPYARAEDPAAEIVEQGCKIKEPIYDNSFDFTSLRSEFGHKVINERGDRFEFNVCGNISKGCGNNKNATACLIKNNGSYVLGTSHKLIYKNGSIYFSFTGGDKCTNEKNYTLNVLLMCDYTLDVQPFTILSTAESECSFYIKWETNYACLPLPENMKSNDCTVEDKQTGHKFNFMPLSDSNYRVLDRSGSSFIINVCKPVLYGQNAMCSADSSICYIQNNSTDIRHKFLNYGISQPAPVFENGELTMSFPSNEKCNSTSNFSTTIYFNCDRAIKFGMPDYMGQKGCNHQFTWQTSLACNSVRPCVAYNPVTAKEYDFNVISDSYTVQHDMKNYTLGICKKAGSLCEANDGACEMGNGKKTSLGIATTSVVFNGIWSPYLLYTDGDICNEKKDKWSTKIEFVCATSDMEPGPKVIENKNCQVLIQFVTKSACKEQILCKVENYDNNEKYDLTPLISTSENYLATISDDLTLKNKNSLKFFLNVCRPLVPHYGLSCPAGSAACKAVMIPSSSTPEQEQSLGYPDVSLTFIEKSRVQLKYLQGHKCSADESVEMSSTIDFVCDVTAGKGNPILKSIIDDCHYQFHWATNVMCTSHQCKFDGNTCDIINDETHKSFNMKTAKFTEAGKISVKVNSESFKIDICGSNRSAVTDYAHSTIKVFFETGGPCGIGGSISVELRLVCRDTQSQLLLSANKTCSLVLTQETPEICPLLGLAVPPIATATTTESSKAVPTSDETKGKMVTFAAAIIGLSMIATVVMSIVCLRDPAKRMAVKNFFRKNAPAVLYRRVNTVEEANLLLPHENLTDSDDDLLI